MPVDYLPACRCDIIIQPINDGRGMPAACKNLISLPVIGFYPRLDRSLYNDGISLYLIMQSDTKNQEVQFGRSLSSSIHW